MTLLQGNGNGDGSERSRFLTTMQDARSVCDIDALDRPLRLGDASVRIRGKLKTHLNLVTTIEDVM